MEKQADRMMLDSHIHVILTVVSDGTGPATGKHQTPAIKQAPTWGSASTQELLTDSSRLKSPMKSFTTLNKSVRPQSTSIYWKVKPSQPSPKRSHAALGLERRPQNKSWQHIHHRRHGSLSCTLPGAAIKVLVHRKIWILSFTHVILNPYMTFDNNKHKMRCFKECPSSLSYNKHFHNMENCCQIILWYIRVEGEQMIINEIN